MLGTENSGFVPVFFRSVCFEILIYRERQCYLAGVWHELSVEYLQEQTQEYLRDSLVFSQPVNQKPLPCTRGFTGFINPVASSAYGCIWGNSEARNDLVFFFMEISFNVKDVVTLD